MLVGISGAKRSGKDTLGEFLQREHGFARLSFAGPLKEMLRAYYIARGLTEDQADDRIHGALKDQVDPETGISPRFLMQTLGTEWGRDTVGKNFWVDTLVAKVEHLRSLSVTHIVVTDVRFQGEIDAIRELGGLCAVVRRPDVEPDMGVFARLKRWLTGKRIHASELLWSQSHLFDTVIANTGTLSDFEAKMRIFADHFIADPFAT